MIVTYLDENYCLNCDWLQYSVHLSDEEPELFCPDGFRIDILPGNNIFRHRACVFDSDGQKVLTLLWSPYSRKLSRYLMTVQVANYWLYRDAIAWADRLLHEIVDCQFNSMGRIDLCCDFYCDRTTFNKIRKLSSGAAYVERKSVDNVYRHRYAWGLDEVPVLSPHCLHWGNPQTEIRPKLYNKTYELDPFGKSQFDKPYIVSEWKEAGLDIRHVWRLEFSVSGASTLLWNGQKITLEMCTNSTWRLDTFVSMLQSRFKLRYNDGRKSKGRNDDRIMYIINLGRSDTKLEWRLTGDKSKPKAEMIRLLHNQLQLLESPVCTVNPDVYKCISRTVLQLCENQDVRVYFESRFGTTPSGWLHMLNQNSGLGVHYVEPELRMEI